MENDIHFHHGWSWFVTYFIVINHFARISFFLMEILLEIYFYNIFIDRTTIGLSGYFELVFFALLYVLLRDFL